MLRDNSPRWKGTKIDWGVLWNRGMGGLGRVWQSNNAREFEVLIEGEQWKLVGEPQFIREGKMLSGYTGCFISCPERYFPMKRSRKLNHRGSWSWAVICKLLSFRSLTEAGLGRFVVLEVEGEEYITSGIMKTAGRSERSCTYVHVYKYREDVVNARAVFGGLSHPVK